MYIKHIYHTLTHTLLHKIHEVLGSKLLACILGLPDYPEGILIFNLVCMRWALYTRGIVWCSKSLGHVSKTHTHMHNLESNVKTEENCQNHVTTKTRTKDLIDIHTLIHEKAAVLGLPVDLIKAISVFFLYLETAWRLMTIIFIYRNRKISFSCIPSDVFDISIFNLQSFEEARLAMLVVRPVMLVTDESCHRWYSNFQKDDIPSLRWHVSLNSPSSDFMKMWNGMWSCGHLKCCFEE